MLPVAKAIIKVILIYIPVRSAGGGIANCPSFGKVERLPAPVADKRRSAAEGAQGAPPVHVTDGGERERQLELEHLHITKHDRKLRLPVGRHRLEREDARLIIVAEVVGGRNLRFALRHLHKAGGIERIARRGIDVVRLDRARLLRRDVHAAEVQRPVRRTEPECRRTPPRVDERTQVELHGEEVHEVELHRFGSRFVSFGVGL